MDISYLLDILEEFVLGVCIQRQQYQQKLALLEIPKIKIKLYADDALFFPRASTDWKFFWNQVDTKLLLFPVSLS